MLYSHTQNHTNSVTCTEGKERQFTSLHSIQESVKLLNNCIYLNLNLLEGSQSEEYSMRAENQSFEDIEKICPIVITDICIYTWLYFKVDTRIDT